MNNSRRLALLLLLILMPLHLFAAEKLVFVVDIIRHGDRTPGGEIPTANFKWKQGLGQLTAEGMRQEYELGAKLRKRYITQAHLLPKYYKHGTLYVRSTDYDRTLMSAQSFLTGLYPPTEPTLKESTQPALPYGFQPIPIFSAPREYDDVILKYIPSEEHTRLLQRYLYPTKEWQQKYKAVQPKFPEWSRLLGTKIDSLEDLEEVGDILYIHQLHRAPMPPGLSAEDIETIIDVGAWTFMAQVNSPQLATIYSRQLMLNIADYLKKGSQESSKLKYVLFSAHDDTIGGALSYLDAPLNIAPPFASHLSFSLYKSGTHSYSVKITYNDTPVVIPACGGMVCDLDQFIELVQKER